MFFLALIFAPIIETFFCQLIPISLSQRFIKYYPNIIGVTISTILFSWIHLNYSIWYAIALLPVGVLLANTYIIFQKRKESSFWMTSFLHSFRNLIPFIFSISEKYW